MAINLRKWRLPARPKLPHVGAIGEPDAHVFNCPKCARPLTEGTPRCPGCGVRLIMGVVFRRAGTLMGFGFVIGLFIGGVITSAVITTLIHPATPTVAAAPAGDGTTAPISPGPRASSGTVVPPAVIPAAALSSLRQSSLLDARIADDADALSRAYKAKASAVDIALILRSLASDAAIGSDIATQLRTWDEGTALAADRAAFYAAVSAIAHDGLRASMSDKKSYRATARAMLNELKALAGLDAGSRALAVTAGIELPDVDLGVLAPK
jgi:hypothetical protein